jgi:hypothetical protein
MPGDSTRGLPSPVIGERVCESCGREDDDLVAVRRIYVTPESWDTPGSSKTMPDVEVWCFPCRTMYPHEPVDGD